MTAENAEPKGDGDQSGRRVHIILNSHMVDNAGASPVWGLIVGILMTTAERRSLEGQFFTFHMSELVTPPGPLKDRFVWDLAHGRVTAVVAIGLTPGMLTDINRHGVPVIGFCGAGNHFVLPNMHEQVDAATTLLVDAGCRRIEFWSSTVQLTAPTPFSVYDLVDTAGIVRRFRNHKDAAAHRILDCVSTETARQILSVSDSAPVTFEIRHWVCDALNAAETSVTLWDESFFSAVKLNQSTVEALDRWRAGETDHVSANRLLIQNTFAAELRQFPKSEPDAVNAFQTALLRQFPDDEPARVRYAERTEVGDVGNQLPSYNLARAVFGGSSPHPDGLVIDDDMAASGVHKALEELGLKIGSDVKIATHANAGSAVGFGLHGRSIQMLFDPTDFVQGMLDVLDHQSVNDIHRPRIARVLPRLVAPARR